MFKEDLHLHTEYSPDSKEKMENVIKKAVEKNVDVICITDHIDIPEPFFSLRSFDFSGRVAEYEKLKEKYRGKIKLLLGLEFAEPNIYAEDYKRILSEYEYDMIIGSVHEPADWRFEGRIGADEMSEIYYERLLKMAKTGGFEVLGHLDFPKKFFKDFVPNEEISRAVLDECVKNGIVLEINTATLRLGQSEPCPTMDLVKYYRDRGGKYVTVSSDSHSCESVAGEYEQVYDMLPKGLKVCYFEKRKMTVPEQR